MLVAQDAQLLKHVLLDGAFGSDGLDDLFVAAHHLAYNLESFENDVEALVLVFPEAPQEARFEVMVDFDDTVQAGRDVLAQLFDFALTLGEQLHVLGELLGLGLNPSAIGRNDPDLLEGLFEPAGNLGPLFTVVLRFGGRQTEGMLRLGAIGGDLLPEVLMGLLNLLELPGDTLERYELRIDFTDGAFALDDLIGEVVELALELFEVAGGGLLLVVQLAQLALEPVDHFG
jgi:hypothetical protein